MNNLLAQQKGLSATSEDAVGVSNFMGKALMGNVGALTRVGITLTDHQKELIKTGDEYTRATTLAQAITDNVCNMNAELAKTGSLADKRQSYQNVQGKASRIQEDYEIGIIGKEEAERQMNPSINLPSASLTTVAPRLASQQADSGGTTVRFVLQGDTLVGAVSNRSRLMNKVGKRTNIVL